MGFIFPSKIEKLLSKVKKRALPLELSYVDGTATHASRLTRYDRDKAVVTGFAASLRVDTLALYIPGLNMRFRTRVLNVSQDIRGQLLYHCSLPEDKDLKEGPRKNTRYFIYPRGVAAFAYEDKLEEALEEDGAKVNKCYVWDINQEGLELLNSSNRLYEVGAKFFACKLLVGSFDEMVELEVSYLAEKPFRSEMAKIVGCKFIKPPKNMELLMKTCKKIDLL